MSLHLFQQVNQFLPMFVFGILTYRTTAAWKSESWPTRYWHHRTGLLLLCGFSFLTALGSIAREQQRAPATYVSPLFTVICVATGAFAWFWPKGT